MKRLKRLNLKKLFILNYSFLIILLASCSVTKQISKQANKILLQDSAINTGNIGICIYDPVTQKYLYNHNATHYFIPASNTKLFTLYAGMKYLGDSLIGGYYQNFSDTAINFFATGDPTFLHPDFANQLVLNFLKKDKRKIYVSGKYNDEALGYGWAWDDYTSNDMAERSIFPLHGNVVNIDLEGYSYVGKRISFPTFKIVPKYFEDVTDSSYLLDIVRAASIEDTNEAKKQTQNFEIERKRISNQFSLIQSNSKFKSQKIPFYVDGNKTSINILQKDYNLPIYNGRLIDDAFYGQTPDKLIWHPIYTQPSDSLFKIMMHRSDNFFAEQILIMVSKQGLNNLADKNETLVLIDTILKTSLQDLPQRPKWVDGSGLSRYNLATPQSIVYLLNKIKNEFGLDRVKNILATGGTGTLTSYYKKNAGHIFAKTGTLSNNCALSGYIITKKGKLLLFSILNNNYITGATPIRKAVEKFIEGIIEKY